jgi:hypothetical protein
LSDDEEVDGGDDTGDDDRQKSFEFIRTESKGCGKVLRPGKRSGDVDNLSMEESFSVTLRRRIRGRGIEASLLHASKSCKSLSASFFKLDSSDPIWGRISLGWAEIRYADRKTRDVFFVAKVTGEDLRRRNRSLLVDLMRASD